MCGIAGYIGKSKKTAATYQLITKLFEKSESRGIDASGYWGTEPFVDGHVIYHKEPIKSSKFVLKDVWKTVKNYNPDLLLVHARAASSGVGQPCDNQNNHPFTSEDKSLALIHNGRVDDVEYHTLKQKYELKTLCDSEILLRIIEGGEVYPEDELLNTFGDVKNAHRLAGMRDVFSLINEGHMAVALGERGINGDRMLWLFRNKYRPLWIVDMRECLNQIFFVSEPNVWNDAIQECTYLSDVLYTQKLIELPTEEIWHFQISQNNSEMINVEKYQVNKGNFQPWKFDGIKQLINKKPSSFHVLTELDEKDQLLPTDDQEEWVEEAEEIEWEEFPMSELDKKIEKIIFELKNVKVCVEQLVKEQSIDRHEFDELLRNLDQFKDDIKQELGIINR